MKLKNVKIFENVVNFWSCRLITPIKTFYVQILKIRKLCTSVWNKYCTFSETFFKWVAILYWVGKISHVICHDWLCEITRCYTPYLLVCPLQRPLCQGNPFVDTRPEHLGYRNSGRISCPMCPREKSPGDRFSPFPRPLNVGCVLLWVRTFVIHNINVDCFRYLFFMTDRQHVCFYFKILYTYCVLTFKCWHPLPAPLHLVRDVNPKLNEVDYTHFAV